MDVPETGRSLSGDRLANNKRKEGFPMKRNYGTFTDAFERGEIDVGNFTHEDHIGVAYAMLHRYDFLTATLKYATCIDALATQAGAAQKYNTTITLAFMSIIAERIQQSGAENFGSFLGENPDLCDRDLLTRWYSKERQQSDLARTNFLMPDRAPYSTPF
jgi:hypothetical protein